MKKVKIKRVKECENGKKYQIRREGWIIGIFELDEDNEIKYIIIIL